MRKVGKLTMTVCMAAFLVPVFLAGCGKETDSAGSGTVSDGAYEKFEEVELRLSCNGTETANDAKAAYRIADKLSEKSGGRVTMTVFTNDQLSGGNMSKGLEMLCNGTVDLDIHSTSVISNLDNRLMVSTLPWLFSDYQEAEDAFYGEGGEYIDSILQEKGVYYLGAVHNGFKAITNSKHPIQKPEDLNKNTRRQFLQRLLFDAWRISAGHVLVGSIYSASARNHRRTRQLSHHHQLGKCPGSTKIYHDIQAYL